MENILRFFHEIGHLRQIKHEGWRLVGVNHPDSVAEHSLRAAQIGYVLAHMEGYSDPYQVCTMVVFHDMGECRIGDLHKMAARYVEADEERAVREQTERLGGTAGEELLRFWKEVDERSSHAGNIAKDADLLEQAITAKEYVELGHAGAKEWVENVGRMLRTESAKTVFKNLDTVSAFDWFHGLKSFK